MAEWLMVLQAECCLSYSDASVLALHLCGRIGLQGGRNGIAPYAWQPQLTRQHMQHRAHEVRSRPIYTGWHSFTSSQEIKKMVDTSKCLITRRSCSWAGLPGEVPEQTLTAGQVLPGSCSPGTGTSGGGSGASAARAPLRSSIRAASGHQNVYRMHPAWLIRQT
jgi:hypothetical protein